MNRKPGPYGFDPMVSCQQCPVHGDTRAFCGLGPETLADLHLIRQSAFYPRGAVLFVEDQVPAGVFVVCRGRVKLSASSPCGRSVILRVAQPGDVLGLSAVATSSRYWCSAETLQPSEVSFIPADRFLALLQCHADAAERGLRQLAHDLRDSGRQVARLALAPTIRARFAGLLLEWTTNQHPQEESRLRFELPLTHEEVAALIGTSRESVTRLFSGFRRAGLLRTSGRFVTVTNVAGLRDAALCDGRHREW